MSMNFECICVQVSNTISNTKSTQIILPHEEDPAERAAVILQAESSLYQDQP